MRDRDGEGERERERDAAGREGGSYFTDPKLMMENRMTEYHQHHSLTRDSFDPNLRRFFCIMSYRNYELMERERERERAW